MANFCKYCGRTLQDGEICTCPQAQAEAAQMYQGQQPPQGYQQPPQGYQQGYQQPPQGYQQPAAPKPAGAAFQKIVPYLKSYIKAPVSTAQGLIAQKDIVFAAIMLCIQAVAGGLLMFSFVGSYLKNLGAALLAPALVSFKLLSGGKVYSQITELAADLMDEVADSELSVKFSASIPMSLIFGILAAVVAIAVFVLVAFAICRIVGSKCSIQDVAVAAAAHSPIVTVLLLVSFLFFLFFMPLGVCFLALAMLAWMILAVPTLLALAPSASQDKFWACTIVGILLTLLVGGFAVHTFGSMAVGHATVKVKGQKEQTINDLREDVEDALDDMDVDDLMRMMRYF